MYAFIHTCMVTRSAAPPDLPQMVWEAAPLLRCGLWGVVGGNPPPSFPWWGRIRGPSRVGSPGGREASLVRQTIFCGRRFCSETVLRHVRLGVSADLGDSC